MSSHNLVAVGTYSNKFDADVAKTALDAAGIESMIRVDDATGYPGMWISNGVKLLVNEDDAARADEVLNAPTESTTD